MAAVKPWKVHPTQDRQVLVDVSALLSVQDAAKLLKELTEVLEKMGDLAFNLRRVDLGRRIRQRRTEHGISQQALARMLRVPQTTVSHIENGYRGADRPMLERIAKVMGLTVEQLLDPVGVPRQAMPGSPRNIDTEGGSS